MRSSFETELDILQSKGLLTRVAEDLKLFLNYYHKEGLLKKEVLSEDLPFEINFLNDDSEFYNLDTIISLKGLSTNHYNLFNQEGDLVG